MGGGVSSRLATGVARLLAVLSCGVGSGACAAAVPSGVAEPEMSFPAPNHPVPRPLGNPAGDERTRDWDGEAALVLDALRIVPGMRVADLQSGDGYYAVRIARRLGAAGAVLVVESDAARFPLLRSRLDRSGFVGVRVIDGLPADPRLPPRSVDAAVLAFRYHEIRSPFEYLHRLQPAFAPGGRLGIVERDRPVEYGGTTPALLRCELEAVGYRQVELIHLTPADGYLAVFEPPREPPEPVAIRACAPDR